jgi:hypothetical protein
VAGLDQVDGHGQAHDSESDDCNVAHDGSLSEVWVVYAGPN